MSSEFERAERAALYIFLAGVGVAMIAAAGPLAFPDMPRIVWQVIASLGAILTVLSAGFLFYEYRDLMRIKRMTPFFGMLVSGILFVGFTAWYFWPKNAQPKIEKAAEPSQSVSQEERARRPNAAPNPIYKYIADGLTKARDDLLGMRKEDLIVTP
jgi:hypothetical protein